jgi:multicomponent Na+:H+ antiporter subunit E
MLAANLALALLWPALTGSFSLSAFGFGFVLAYLMLWLVQRRSPYFTKAPQTVGFAAFFVKELVYSALQVAYDVLTIRHRMRPAIVAVPLDARSDLEITLLSNLVTLTPGTLTLEVSSDRSVLYIHAMYVYDLELTRRRIKRGFERRVLRLVR